jgi:hypothetical protein
MASSEVKNAIESQQARGISKIDPVSLPGFGPANQADTFNPDKYRVRYSKIDFDDPGSIAELEILETRAIRNKGVFILTKEKFNFMDRCFLLVSYLEEEVTKAEVKK